MNIFFFLNLLLIGAVIGSYANVCVYRWPRNGSTLNPKRSHCPWCKIKLSWNLNIPIISYLLLNGKCNNCLSSISFKYLFIEIIMPLGWLLVGYVLFNLQFPENPIFLLSVLFMVFCMIVTSAIDIDWKIIPDSLSIGLIIVGLIVSPMNFLLGNSGAFDRLVQSMMGLVTGGLCLFIVSLGGQWIWKKEVMGMGDIKLLAGLGAFLGWQGALVTFFIAAIISGVLSLIGLTFKILRRNQYIPFGPFLNLGGFFTLIFHKNIPDFLALIF